MLGTDAAGRLALIHISVCNSNTFAGLRLDRGELVQNHSDSQGRASRPYSVNDSELPRTFTAGFIILPETLC